MKQFMVAFSLINVASCTSFTGAKITSQWSELHKAKSMDCADWPLQDQDLRVEDIKVIQSDTETALLGKVRKRNGSWGYHYTKFKGDENIESEDIRQLSVGLNAIVMSGHFPNNGEQYALADIGEDETYRFEVRDIKTNVVQSKLNIKAQDFTEGAITKVESGFWLLSSQDLYRISYISNDKGSLTERSYDLGYDSEPVITRKIGTNEINILSLEHGTNSKFTIQNLHTSGDKGNRQEIQVKELAQGVESWDAVGTGNGVQLVYVSGDSVVGDAKLNFTDLPANFAGGQPVSERQVSLQGLHVSEPIWVKSFNNPGSYAVMLKWLDGESTVGVYDAKAPDKQEQRNYGVLKKGTALIDAFAFGSESDIYAILRLKENRNWRYQICEINH